MVENTMCTVPPASTRTVRRKLITGSSTDPTVFESGRPSIGGGFDDARAYREAVARLSLATLTAIALRETQRDDDDVDILLRMALLCQVIDDALDYREDLAAGLPSYMTSMASWSEALESTARAARLYGSRGAGVFPLRIALGLVSAAAQLTLRLARSPDDLVLARTEPVEIER